MEVDHLKADFESHHIEGIAVQGNTPFSVALISHIKGNLWSGGCIGGASLGDKFKYIISLYPWEKYRIAESTMRFEFELYDSSEVPPLDALRPIAEMVNTFREDGPTLVHCQAGLNRSGLITAYALILGGMKPREAITLLREKRCKAVLCNSSFEAWLLGSTGLDI